MTRATHLKRLAIGAFGIGGIVVACHATSPEAPPLAPLPDPTAPVPSEPNTPGPTFPPADARAPTPTAPLPTPMPNPMPTNNGPISVSEVPTPVYASSAQMQVVDAGLRDAPLAPDAAPKLDAAIPVDAAKPIDALLPPAIDARPRGLR